MGAHLMLYYSWLGIKKIQPNILSYEWKSLGRNLSDSMQTKDVAIFMHQVFGVLLLSVRYENSWTPSVNIPSPGSVTWISSEVLGLSLELSILIFEKSKKKKAWELQDKVLLKISKI